MAFVVPYDGSSVSDAALDRAVEHAKAMNEEVLAVSLVATGSEYVERRKWIQPTEDFALESARAELERKIAETTDDVERTYEDARASAPQDGIGERIRQVADEVDASVLFVGTSDNGDDETLQTPFGSITSDASYDVHIVRTL